MENKEVAYGRKSEFVITNVGEEGRLRIAESLIQIGEDLKSGKLQYLNGGIQIAAVDLPNGLRIESNIGLVYK